MFSSISIEFDNSRIKITESIKKGNSLSVLKCLRVELPKNCIANGEIVSMSVVKALLEKALNDNSIKTSRAAFIINSNSIISRKIEMPYLKSRKDTRSMLRYNLEDVFSADPEQYVFIYKVSDVFMLKGVKYAYYIIQGMPKKIYDQYMELSKNLKLELKKLDNSSNCLENLSAENLNVNFKQYKSENLNVFVNINRNSLCFSVINNSISEFFRIYYFDENETDTEIVAEGLGSYHSSDLNNIGGRKNNTDVSRYTEVISQYMKYYYSVNKNKTGIDMIYVYGDECRQGIDKELGSRLGKDVEIILDVSNITAVKSAAQNNFEIKEYLNCALTQLKSTKNSNFLTEGLKRRKIKFNTGVAVMSALIILVLALVLGGVNDLYMDGILRDEIEVMKLFIENEENIKQNLRIEEEKQKIDNLKMYLKHASMVSRQIENEDCISSELIKGIKASVPYGTSVNSIFIDENNVQLMCKSDNMAEISMFLERLRNYEFIKNVYIPEIEIEINEDGEEEGYSYQILCNTSGESDENK